MSRHSGSIPGTARTPAGLIVPPSPAVVTGHVAISRRTSFRDEEDLLRYLAECRRYHTRPPRRVLVNGMPFRVRNPAAYTKPKGPTTAADSRALRKAEMKRRRKASRRLQSLVLRGDS